MRIFKDLYILGFTIEKVWWFYNFSFIFYCRHTEAEGQIEEISGVAFIFNQKFFNDLYEAKGIDLENIVYYKDETHYFVMTAKKQSLIDKGMKPNLNNYFNFHIWKLECSLHKFAMLGKSFFYAQYTQWTFEKMKQTLNESFLCWESMHQGFRYILFEILD